MIAGRKAAPGDENPHFCLKAERARPPEDCGGFPGYRELMEALSKPAAKRSKGEKEILKWLTDDWDLERCDIGAINKTLAKD